MTGLFGFSSKTSAQQVLQDGISWFDDRTTTYVGILINSKELG